jgi:hypothetical protein
MKIGICVQVFPHKFKGCSVGITDGFVNYDVQMVSGAMIHIPNLINIGSGIQKLFGCIHIQRHREKDDLIRILLFFEMRKVGYKVMKEHEYDYYT